MFNVTIPWYDLRNGRLLNAKPFQSLDCDLVANTRRNYFDRVEYYSGDVSVEKTADNVPDKTPDK
jgi:hypothetical protein